MSDGKLSTALPSFSIVVAPNRAPTISGTPATTVTVGQSYSFTPTAADADGQSLTFSIVNKPTWASFSTDNGRLSGTPAAADVGVHTGIVIRVSDGSDDGFVTVVRNHRRGGESRTNDRRHASDLGGGGAGL